MVGWSDLAADLGDRAQLQRLSEALPAGAVMISSDLIRARATADAIAKGRQRLADAPALREIHFGDWEMRSFAEVEAEDPARLRAYYDTPGKVRPPGGESWDDVCVRVNACVDALAQDHGDQDIIAVAHFGVILTQVQRALGISARAAFAHRIDTLSVTQISHDGHWRAGPINHIV